jgi:transposase
VNTGRATQSALPGKPGFYEGIKDVKELKKELERKEKALAEAAALLVLKKKAQSIWGDEDEGTPRKNGP